MRTQDHSIPLVVRRKSRSSDWPMHHVSWPFGDRRISRFNSPRFGVPESFLQTTKENSHQFVPDGCLKHDPTFERRITMSNFTPKPRRNKPDPLKQRQQSPQGGRISSDLASGMAKPNETQKPLFTRETVFAWVAAVLLGEVRPPVQKPPVVTEPFKRGRK